MRQLAIRLMNLALVAVCSFQGAEVVNLVATASLQPGSTYDIPAPTSVEPTLSQWDARKTILDRNLFGAKILDESALASEPVIQDEVEETKLPLVLEGTVSGPDLAVAQAAILDTRSRSSMVLGVGDALEGYSNVTVAVIERGRVVLKNGGRHEELLLDESDVTFGVDGTDGGPASISTASTGRSPRVRTPRNARRPSSRSRAIDARARRIQDMIGDGKGELSLDQITAEIEQLRELEQQ
jgi:type II secretory pathway component PulC